jgi:hypothetical protein
MQITNFVILEKKEKKKEKYVIFLSLFANKSFTTTTIFIQKKGIAE